MAEIIESMTQHVPSNTKVNAALTLGIIGTALGALGSGMGAFKRKVWGDSSEEGGCINHEELYIERKMNSDALEGQKTFYEGKLTNLRELTDAFFQSYQRDVDNSFKLYQYSRDNKDELMAKIDAVDKKVDIMAAIRPYQDALIDNKITTSALVADFNLARRTCKMIEGQLVLPTTPTITGLGSYQSYPYTQNDNA